MQAGNDSQVIRFLQRNRYFVKTASETQPLTHTLMDGRSGGRVHVPDSSMDAFFRAYGEDLESGVPLYLVERRSAVFKMHFDVDIKKELEDDELLRVVEVVQRTVLEYYPAIDVLKDERAVAVLCTSMRDGLRVSSSMHLVFPRLYVDDEQAYHIHRGVVEACKHCLGESLGVNFEEALDICVITKNGMRMLGSDKCKRCPSCYGKPNAREFCDVCQSSGHLRENKRYLPWSCCPKGSAKARELEETLCANLAHAAKMCSTRLPQGTLATPGFVVPVGAPQPSRVARKRSGDEVAVLLPPDERKYPKTVGKLEVLHVEERTRTLLADTIRGMNANWARLDVKDVKYFPKKSCYLIRVRGYGERYCLNKRADHTSQQIYFQLSAEGLCQRCWSEKEHVHGCCRTFQSMHVSVDDELFELFFGSTTRAALGDDSFSASLREPRDFYFTHLGKDEPRELKPVMARNPRETPQYRRDIACASACAVGSL